MQTHDRHANAPQIPPNAREFYITGGPGCGKTDRLSHHIKQAIEQGRNPLVVALTRNTAAELANRNPELTVSRIGTIHSICYSALSPPDPNIADTQEGIRRWNDAHNTLYSMSEIRDRDEFSLQRQSSADHPDLLMAEYQRLRATRKPVPTEGPLAEFAQRWLDWCGACDCMDFNGMLERCIERRIAPPSQPDIIFADEAQDLTPLELALLREWSAAGSTLVLSGDPNQNLYQWRGSDSSALNMAAQAPAGHHDVLSQSHRVPRHIHQTTLEWLEQCPTKPAALYEPAPRDGSVNRIPASWHKPEQVINLAEENASQGRTAMILASCAYMLVPTIHHLHNAGISFHNPWRTRNTDWNPNPRDQLGITPFRRILAYLNFNPASRSAIFDAKLWTAVAEHEPTFRQGRPGWTQLNRLSEDDPASQHDLLTNLLTPTAFAAASAGDLAWLAQNLLHGATDDTRYAIKVAARGGAPALTQTPRIIVGTIHSVKGAEADAVYIFPDLPMPAMREWLGPPNQQAGIYRQFYVAMTRSRDELTICAPAGTMTVDL